MLSGYSPVMHPQLINNVISERKFLFYFYRFEVLAAAIIKIWSRGTRRRVGANVLEKPAASINMREVGFEVLTAAAVMKNSTFWDITQQDRVLP
jgi:hypothetical protein